MCNICIDEEKTLFVFPQEDEEPREWLERLQNHDSLALAMMRHTDDGLIKIAESYRLQGFTHQEHQFYTPRPSDTEHQTHTHPESRPFFNVLYLRDLVFITYGDIFARAMGWENEPHV